MTLFGRAAVAAMALLVAVQVVRNAAVRALADTRPANAAALWSGHPQAELGVAMTAIGSAAHLGQPVGREVFDKIDDAAKKAPLAAEPFLVRGVQAQLAGETTLARRAFEAAQWRDPRSLPARYFLADHYLRAGDVKRGLTEFAALARLAPNGIVNVTPYVATYARNPARWPQLKALFRSDPDLAETTLEALAHDGANTTAILALADRPHRNARSPWLPVLLATLVSEGQYQQARAIWAGVAGVRESPGQLLFDTHFADASAPPPFNWTLASSTIGLAERQGGGQLHVIYYGQEEGALASQLLTLAPGHYALGMRVSGGGARRAALRWTLTCADAQMPFATISLDALARGSQTFDVPANCGAQRLELVGSSSDIPQQVDATIGQMSLTRANANG
jgi:hypothetical protein